jgi:DNA polymerase III delta prime subunit
VEAERNPAAGRALRLSFYGPPGAGKTRAALGIARWLGKPLYQVDYSQIISKYLGDTAKHIATTHGMRQLAARSEILDEGFQIHTPDRRTEKDMQARGIRDAADFLAESIGHPIKADFQSLDNVLLTGKDLPFLPPFLATFLATFLA